MANLVERAPRTIQAIELGHLLLSEELAMCIAQATGVDAGWLLDNKTDVPPRKGLTAFGLASGKGEYTRSDYELHRAFSESPALSKEEKEEIMRMNQEIGPEYVTLPLSAMKPLLLAQKKKVLQKFDEETVNALKTLLESTIATDTGDLIRWKTRRFLLSLAADHSVKLDLTAAPSMDMLHLHVIDESDDSPKKRRTKKKS